MAVNRMKAMTREAAAAGRTGLVYGDVFLRHDTGPGHPERPERLRAVMDRLEEEGLTERLVLIEPREAPPEWIAGIHDKDYIREACRPGGRFTHSADTPVSADSLPAALHAAGGVMKAADAVMAGAIANAFCAVRPPGHHAMRDRATGFCLFNNAAIAANYLLEAYGLEKVAVLDWDVHHGNATQDAFYEDPRVLFVSVHRHPFYPGTGCEDEKGSGDGYGLTLNIPLPAGSGDAEYVRALKETALPRIAEFSPGFILISAGFDALRGDPLGGMELTPEGISELTGMVKALAGDLCGGRIVSVLEGGYNLAGLAEAVAAHVEILSRP